MIDNFTRGFKKSRMKQKAFAEQPLPC